MASKGINKVIIVGNLGKDPEMKYTATGSAVCNVTIATSESWTDKQTNEKVEKTEWHRVVAFQKLAEIMGEYLKKGSQVYVEGKLTTRKWQDADGKDRYTTEIVADQMQMLGSKGEAKPEAKASDKGFRKPAAETPQPDFEDNDLDDLPF